MADGAIHWRVRYHSDAGTLTVSTVAPSADPEALASADCPADGEGFAISTGEARLTIQPEGTWEAVVEQQVDTPIDEPPFRRWSPPR